MSRTCLIPAAFAVLVATSTMAYAAGPVTRQCDYKGEGKLGPLTVAYDETARLVRVTTTDGRIWRYQDGATGRLGPTIAAADDPGPVEQFVTNKGRPGRGRLPLAGRRIDRPSRLFRPLGFQEPGEALRLAVAVEFRDGVSAAVYSAATFGRCASEASSAFGS